MVRFTNYNSIGKEELEAVKKVVKSGKLSSFLGTHSKDFYGGKKVIDVHFGGVQNILQSVNLSALKRFVQIGSSDEYGNLSAPQTEDMRESPITPYSFGKVASTQLLQMLHRTEGLPIVILRLFLVYGPGQDYRRFIPQVIQGCLSADHTLGNDGRAGACKVLLAGFLLVHSGHK